MDFWVVAAATGAGYIAKYCQNLSGEKDNLPANSCSLSLINRQSDIGNVLQQIPDTPLPLQKLARKLLDGDPWINNIHVQDEKFEEKKNLANMPMICNWREVFQENSDEIYGKRLQSRSRRQSMDIVKPVEKENGFSVGALMPPLLVTGAHNIIRRRNSSSNDLPLEGRSMRFPEKPEKNLNGMLLLLVGIAIGRVANEVAHESELDKLNELLKQAENLVSDLREEIELKDMITMKELTEDDKQLSGSNSIALLSSGMVSYSCKPELINVLPGQMSEIEAELEAELERLEFDMSTPVLERISDYIELDSDYEADVANGVLKVGVSSMNHDYPSDTDHDKSGTTGEPIDDVNYAVSPWELTLRLHELIESRLKSRIKELESMLNKSQPNEEQSLHVTSLSGFAHSEVDSLFTSDMPSLSLPSEGLRAQRWEDWTSSRGSNDVDQSQDEDEDDGLGGFC